MSSFEVTPLNFWEIDKYTYLRYQAFATSDISLFRCFFPTGYSFPVHSFLRRGTENSLPDKNELYTLIRDPTLSGKAVGAMHWTFYPDPRPLSAILAEEAQDAEKRAAQAPIPGVNFPALNAFREIQATVHREAMQGRPHAYLGILVVDPAHQRQGVGLAALSLALQKVDEMGLEAYLEGTAAGKRLYENCGFEVRREFSFDAREWGMETEVVHYVMVRPAKSERSW